MRYYRIFLYVMLAATGVAMLLVYHFMIVESVPDTILLREGQEETIAFSIPVTATINAKEDETFSQVSTLQVTQAMSDSGLCVETPMTTSFSIVPGDATSYTMDLKCMGFLPMKTVTLTPVDDREIYISGEPIGIYLKTQGVLVIDTGSYVNYKGEEVSPSEDVLQPGDYITEVNGEGVVGKRKFVSQIEDSEGEEMILTILRNGEVSEVQVKPCMSEDGIYKLGIWIRDSAQGIGTLSYFTSEGEFAALGHGVNDADAGCLLELKKGSIYETSILSIRKAEDARPGELTGVLTFDDADYIGKIEENSSEGIYGRLSKEFAESDSGNEFFGDCMAYPAGLKQEIICGPAQIYFELEEAPAFYDVYIDEISYNPGEKNRGIMLTITDEELLEKTGGIVQGMSGSPIVQNGKVVGAVTHVLINDPTKGYGIFIEEMLGH